MEINFWMRRTLMMMWWRRCSRMNVKGEWIFWGTSRKCRIRWVFVTTLKILDAQVCFTQSETSFPFCSIIRICAGHFMHSKVSLFYIGIHFLHWPYSYACRNAACSLVDWLFVYVHSYLHMHLCTFPTWSAWSMNNVLGGCRAAIMVLTWGTAHVYIQPEPFHTLVDEWVDMCKCLLLHPSWDQAVFSHHRSNVALENVHRNISYISLDYELGWRLRHYFFDVMQAPYCILGAVLNYTQYIL